MMSHRHSFHHYIVFVRFIEYITFLSYLCQSELIFLSYSYEDMKDYSFGDTIPKEGQLFDHQPLQLNRDDYERVRQIPVKKAS